MRALRDHAVEREARVAALERRPARVDEGRDGLEDEALALFALSGAILQNMTRNPLADPSLVGISHGAALAVVTLTVLFPAYIDAWYWLRGSYELTITENGQVISRKRWPIKVSAKQKELLAPRLQDKVNSRMNEYLQQLISDSPTL